MAKKAKAKPLSRERYLRGLALYHMGKKASDEADAYRKELERHFGQENQQGHLADAVYSDRPFDEALTLIGFKLPDLRAKRRN